MAGRQSQCKQASHITTLRMRTPPQCRLQHSSQPMHAKQHNSQRLRPVCTPQRTNTELGLCGRESSRCHTLSKQPAWHPTHTEDTGFRAHQHDIVCKHRLHDTVCAAFLVAVWPYQCTTQLLCLCSTAHGRHIPDKIYAAQDTSLPGQISRHQQHEQHDLHTHTCSTLTAECQAGRKQGVAGLLRPLGQVRQLPLPQLACCRGCWRRCCWPCCSCHLRRSPPCR